MGGSDDFKNYQKICEKYRHWVHGGGCARFNQLPISRRENITIEKNTATDSSSKCASKNPFFVFRQCYIKARFETQKVHRSLRLDKKGWGVSDVFGNCAEPEMSVQLIKH